MSSSKRKPNPIWEYFENLKEVGKAVCNICKQELKNNRTFNLKNHLMKKHKINLMNANAKTSNNNSERKQKIKKQTIKKRLIRSNGKSANENTVPIKKNQIDIWEYYDNQSEVGKAVCKICKLVLKNERIFNLRIHLLKKHKVNLWRYECVPSSNDSASTSAYYVGKGNIKMPMNKRTLFKSYIGLVIEDSVPLDVLDSPNFRNIIDPICDGLGKKLGKNITLDAKNCQIALNKVAESIRNNTKTEMDKRLLSLKIDSLSGLSWNIFGISAQFIKEDEIKSLTLGIVELSPSNNLTGEILKILNKYDIELKQVISITSDNEANMVEINYKIKEEPEPAPEYLDDTYLDSIENLQNSSNFCVANIQISQCAALSAHLCALDITTDAEIKAFLQSCRNLTKFILHPSNGFTDVFELTNFQLPQIDYPTHWGSTYEMIEAMISAKEILASVDSVEDKTVEENFHNDDSLWDFMECYHAVFTPLQDVIKKFKAEHLHYGDFYAQWLKCKILTDKIMQINASNDMVNKIGKKILESIEKRTSKLLENESLNACLYLDPRFHHTLNLTKRQQAVVYLNHLWEKLCSVADPSELVSRNTPEKTERNFEDEAEEMLNSFLAEKLQTASCEIAYPDVYTKIESLHLPFLRSDTDVLQYWREKRHTDPELCALSNICFGIPATQVAIEDTASSLKHVLTSKRIKNIYETLEDILLVKLNSSFLNTAIDNLSLFEDDA
ncbi:uncharacterized protein LOC118741222 [Rhagoletis pomonella]|uniref:uncharacterized protein LOC118741222 n=1 Tax=Rhagoletis pomonella TaxID=28610 RepID=UPI00177C5187|nr:uncharacterized protein LOC118741222 [Rhagoletis pomonella]